MDSRLNAKEKHHALALYIVLAGLFIASLVVCNLIANKFISLDLGFYTFVLSAGVLPYPITFLITDFLSEFYGRKRTNYVILSGFIALIFVLFVIWLGSQFNSIENSPISDSSYDLLFGNSQRVIIASMAAYLFAQLIDVRIFHFWKKVTSGRHLWLRNNFSTIISQLVDTTLVVGIIFIDTESFGTIGKMILDGWLFKILCALFDTPIMYIGSWLFKLKFKISEIQYR
ncbi:MAG: queuosine precursor transporter [Schleiferiaceae bacterium]|jgi:hypothetical protein|nr:queuosine precursor transporter [Schleiferiaceae bacterium]MDG1881011.1 queuosine precursor transporter [Schleiferiaceae bacterium]|tara:strand:- start:75 stop:761 length:687 start_codon:yes stop_codon:yes gene_type:complete